MYSAIHSQKEWASKHGITAGNMGINTLIPGVNVDTFRVFKVAIPSSLQRTGL
jgi:hypothetical protein